MREERHCFAFASSVMVFKLKQMNLGELPVRSEPRRLVLFLGRIANFEAIRGRRPFSPAPFQQADGETVTPYS